MTSEQNILMINFCIKMIWAKECEDADEWKCNWMQWLLLQLNWFNSSEIYVIKWMKCSFGYFIYVLWLLFLSFFHCNLSLNTTNEPTKLIKLIDIYSRTIHQIHKFYIRPNVMNFHLFILFFIGFTLNFLLIQTLMTTKRNDFFFLEFLHFKWFIRKFNVNLFNWTIFNIYCT